MQDARVRQLAVRGIARSGKPAGKIDLVVATDNQELRWFGLEVQAVYFSGDAMAPEFRHLQTDEETTPPYPQGRRHPDWRSSTAKRLMPQLQAKVPTLRRWASRIAVAVDAGRAHDDAHAVRDLEIREDLAEGLPVLALDAPRDAAGARVVGHQHKIASGDAQERGQRGTLVAAFLLLDLDDEFLAFVDDVLNVDAALALTLGAGPRDFL